MGVPAFIVFAIGLLDRGCDVLQGRAFGSLGPSSRSANSISADADAGGDPRGELQWTRSRTPAVHRAGATAGFGRGFAPSLRDDAPHNHRSGSV